MLATLTAKDMAGCVKKSITTQTISSAGLKKFIFGQVCSVEV